MAIKPASEDPNYARDGFLSPLTGMSPAEAKAYRGQLESIESRHGDDPDYRYALNGGANLVSTLVDEITTRDEILDAVESVIATLPDFHAAILPFEVPSSRPEALFSIPFSVSVTLAHGAPGLTHITPKYWEDASLQDLMRRVSVVQRKPRNPHLNYDEAEPDELRVLLRNGRTLRAEVAYPVGAPQCPLSREQLKEKFVTNLLTVDGWTESQAVHWFERLSSWRSADNIDWLLDGL